MISPHQQVQLFFSIYRKCGKLFSLLLWVFEGGVPAANLCSQALHLFSASVIPCCHHVVKLYFIFNLLKIPLITTWTILSTYIFVMTLSQSVLLDCFFKKYLCCCAGSSVYLYVILEAYKDGLFKLNILSQFLPRGLQFYKKNYLSL